MCGWVWLDRDGVSDGFPLRIDELLTTNMMYKIVKVDDGKKIPWSMSLCISLVTKAVQTYLLVSCHIFVLEQVTLLMKGG